MCLFCSQPFPKAGLLEQPLLKLQGVNSPVFILELVWYTVFLFFYSPSALDLGYAWFISLSESSLPRPADGAYGVHQGTTALLDESEAGTASSRLFVQQISTWYREEPSPPFFFTGEGGLPTAAPQGEERRAGLWHLTHCSWVSPLTTSRGKVWALCTGWRLPLLEFSCCQDSEPILLPSPWLRFSKSDRTGF